jgi:uncharacterized protein YecE (DUF72 family)
MPFHPEMQFGDPDLAAYDFRGFHPRVRFGTASDRYGGWLGQIYSEDRWASEIKTRRKKLGRQSFEERVLPVECVAEYFDHFETLELDFTFYRPLLEGDGRASSNLFVLGRYAEHAPETARFILKAPQAYTARVLRRGGAGRPAYEDNPTYLDVDAYVSQFLDPARDLLGERLAGVLFEQEYGRVRESPPPEAFIGELDAFFGTVDARCAEPRIQTHLEVRSPHLLVQPYFDWLDARGLGFCFSHWTWLPSIKQQWELAGGRFTAANRNVVLRLLTPRKMRYEEAYATAHPFDRPVPELSETRGAREMVDESAALVLRTIEAECTVDVIVNNRAWGNGPALAQAVARRIGDALNRPTEQ